MVRGRFGSLMDNWVAVIYRLVRVTAFTQAFNQVSTVIPYLFTASYFFAGKIELGVMMQSAGAFMQVACALTFFVTSYVFPAAFKSVVDRLNSFDAAIDKAQALTSSGPARVAAPSGTPATAFEDIDISLPAESASCTTRIWFSPAAKASRCPDRRVRQVDIVSCDRWNFRIRSPDGAHVMVVPAKPFIPNGTLRAGISFPAVTGAYSDDEIRSALADTHLGHLADQLDRKDMWTQRLSTGEQQRLALTGALLMRPQWPFLDEATSALDEKMECELYAVLARRLPNTTIVSISYRSTCVVLHQRHIEMTPQGDHYTLRDVAKAAAAAEGRSGGAPLTAASPAPYTMRCGWPATASCSKAPSGPARASCRPYSRRHRPGRSRRCAK